MREKLERLKALHRAAQVADARKRDISNYIHHAVLEEMDSEGARPEWMKEAAIVDPVNLSTGMVNQLLLRSLIRMHREA